MCLIASPHILILGLWAWDPPHQLAMLITILLSSDRNLYKLHEAHKPDVCSWFFRLLSWISCIEMQMVRRGRAHQTPWIWHPSTMCNLVIFCVLCSSTSKIGLYQATILHPSMLLAIPPQNWLESLLCYHFECTFHTHSKSHACHPISRTANNWLDWHSLSKVMQANKVWACYRLEDRDRVSLLGVFVP